MQKVNRPQGKWRDVVFVCIGLFVIAADQLSKTWIRTNLALGQSIFDVEFFRIIHVYNTGAAFGIFKGHSQTIAIITGIGIVAILVFIFILRSRWAIYDSMLLRSAAGLVVGGMIGNFIDRIRQGYVTDFLDFKIWPAFNAADSVATVGAIILAFCIINLAQPAKHQE